TTQSRLWAVLERYVLWLERLPEAERRLVLDAPTAESRLAVIHGLKQQQWLARLPATVRAELSKLPPDRRAERLRQLRLEEWPQRVLWQRPLKRKADPIPRPKRMSEFPVAVQRFLE